MELYAHNQEAYQDAVRLFRKVNKVCIIRPTGTGKSVIIAQFVKEYPNKRHLLLAPGAHIFKEIGKHIGNKVIFFSTYIGLKTGSSLLRPGAFDFIYLDEFHRLGADVWGATVQQLLKLNPDAKVLGTSATPIRYLDDYRNMAKELFDDNIASEMSLNRAIVEGILSAPKYVSALYSVQEEYSKLEGKILGLKSTDKITLLDRLKGTVVDWEESSGLDKVLKRHLEPSRKRLIVFCRDWEHMKVAQRLLNPIFRCIYGKMDSLRVYTGRKESVNKAAMNRFSSAESIALVMYAIDMINEGLHSKDCNTVILLRETTSPILFYQQIGRAFSVKSKDKPLIFDLVNNFKSILINNFKEDIENEELLMRESDATVGKVREKAVIEFVDETRDIREILEGFQHTADDWAFFFNCARDFFNEHGHLYIPADNSGLYNWVNYQRKRYRQGGFDASRAELLKGIGMDFDNSIPGFWMTMYFSLEKWFLNQSEEPTNSQESQLATWLYRQRDDHKKGRLAEIQIEMLRRFIQLDEFKIPKRTYERVCRLNTFFGSNKDISEADEGILKDLYLIRKMAQRETLANDLIESLTAAGVPFKSHLNDLDWFGHAKKTIEFYESRGVLPKKSENQVLWSWCIRQRKNIRENSFPDLQMLPNQDEVQSIREKVMSLLLLEARPEWDFRYKELAEHIKTKGQFDPRECSTELKRWVHKQQSFINTGKLPVARKEKLLEIKAIDWQSSGANVAV